MSALAYMCGSLPTWFYIPGRPELSQLKKASETKILRVA